MRWPSSVRCDSARSRRSTSPPSSVSRALIARVRDGWVTLHRSAALVKFRVSLTAKKYRIWCISKARPSLPTYGRISERTGGHGAIRRQLDHVETRNMLATKTDRHTKEKIGREPCRDRVCQYE